MLPESVVAGVLALLAVLFFAVRSAWDARKLPPDRSAAELPAGLLAPGYAGLAVFVLVTIAYPVLFVLGRIDLLSGSVAQLSFPGDTTLQFAGMAMLAVGLVLVFWSLRAIDPGMLTTKGPYKRVRHPMYTGYLFVFTGLFPLTLNLLALAPLFVIPAQIAIARIEETALEARYGAVYRAYKARTGEFLPRMR